MVTGGVESVKRYQTHQTHGWMPFHSLHSSHYYEPFSLSSLHFGRTVKAGAIVPVSLQANELVPQTNKNNHFDCVNKLDRYLKVHPTVSTVFQGLLSK